MRNLGETLPPVIIVSGQPLDVISSAARSTDAATFLRKPYTIDELLTAIEEAMS
jgi:FixJ family two-component response regulator